MKKTRAFGTDMHKKERPKIPEAVGVGCGVCFVFSMFCVSALFPARKESILISACVVSLSILLGHVDDHTDLSWWCKFVFPVLSISPVALTYSGSTHVLVPFRGRFDLGWMFYPCISGLSVYFTNAVNILSGINGLESGQVVVISGFMALDRMLFGGEGRNALISLCACFFACTLGVFVLNRYPSRCFVGDTFCYFAGSGVLCLGILGGFTKTVFLFFLPQLLNFALSAPQILAVLPCPRHRMPDTVEGPGPVLLGPSGFLLERPATRSRMRGASLWVLRVLRAVRETNREKNQVWITNGTLLNAVLLHTGPVTEQQLFNRMMCIQGAVCVLVLALKAFGVYT